MLYLHYLGRLTKAKDYPPLPSSTWPLAQHHRALLDAETGAVVKDPGGRLNVALIFPNTYQVGMANLGLHAIYRIINQRSDALCERAFCRAGPRSPSTPRAAPPAHPGVLAAGGLLRPGAGQPLL